MDDSGRRLMARRDRHHDKRGWYVVDELNQTEYLRMDGTVRDAVQDVGGVNPGWWPSKKAAEQAIANYHRSLEANAKG